MKAMVSPHRCLFFRSVIFLEQKLIQRINELARKSKAEGLTNDEKKEQEHLRSQYRAEFRRNLTQQLEHTYIMDENGKKHKLGK